jgi:prophage regulatory protein
MSMLRLQDVKTRVGLGHSTLYKMMNSGRFPRPLRLSDNRVAWLERDVTAWLNRRIAERDSAATKRS